MWKRRGIRILAGCALGAVIVIAWPPGEKEPEYEGRPLHVWVEMLGEPWPGTKTTSEPYPPLEHIGTNAVPFLLKWIASSGLKERLAPYVSKVPRVRDFAPVRRWLYYDFGAAEKRAAGAVLAFGFLGERASAAIPALGQLACAAAEAPAKRAVSCLEGIGPASLPVLLSVSTNGNKTVRARALCPIMGFGTNAAPAVPALIQLLSGPDEEVAAIAASFLAQIGEPEVVGPALTEALEDRRQSVRGTAR
jgi:hypothetical protein